MDQASAENKKRDFLIVLAVWLGLAVTLILLAIPNASVPGLNYDEAHCAGMARDFLSGHAHPHMANCQIIQLFGRPFPTFVQTYDAAVKSWMLIPVFAVFGASQAVLRWTCLGFGLLALLLFQLWTWRWLGRTVAIIAGVLLALDPTYFFINVLDWGPITPSFLARFACFYFALRWWQLRDAPAEMNVSKRKWLLFAFLAGFFAGVGFLNKIDFIVLLGGLLLAFFCCHARLLLAEFKAGRLSGLVLSLALSLFGFAIAASLMLPHALTIMQHAHSFESRVPGGERMEKIHAMLTMYNGSYFYHLMDAGGRFDEMYKSIAPVCVPLGVAMVLAAASFCFRPRREGAFLLLAVLFVTIGIFLMPGAVRIHHMVLLYPLPHLIIALALAQWADRRAAAGLLVVLAALGLFAIWKTQKLIRQTGGRGWWSDAITAFAGHVRERRDLTIVSMDWGFNEQLGFLTDGPRLIEAFWTKEKWDGTATNVIYLLHPPQYTLYPFGLGLLGQALGANTNLVELKPWTDHQGSVAFYSLRFRGR